MARKDIAKELDTIGEALFALHTKLYDLTHHDLANELNGTEKYMIRKASEDVGAAHSWVSDTAEAILFPDSKARSQQFWDEYLGERDEQERYLESRPRPSWETHG